MNILKELTNKNLKLNKKRTIVTIIGIILSVALICAVATMITSFQATLISDAIINGGNRHLTIENVKPNDLQYFTNNSHVKSMYMTETLGYAKYENDNSNKPYAYVLGYTPDAFKNATIKVISGRLPEDDKEIIISENFRMQTKVNVGDILTLNIGKRVCEDNTTLNQHNPYYIEDELDECHEKLIDEVTHEYKVVGIMERPDYSLEDYSAPGYTMITKINNPKDNINISLLFKDASYYKEYTDNIKNDDDLNKYFITYNTDLLRWSGMGLSESTMNMLYTVAGVVIGIIIFTSVFVIKNSFDISNQEKRKMYGMLSSIGATSKQIKKSVLHEGYILGVIGIPLGILSGLFADYILIIIVNSLGKYVFEGFSFVYSVSYVPIIISIILGSLTIYLSVIRAAKKSSKISPIEAIRNNNEIKISSKKIKSPKIIDKLFGIGGNIAYKNLKRNKKRNRTTIVSIVLSVAVFISLSSFLDYGFKITNKYYVDINYSIEVYINEKDKNLNTKTYNDILSFEGINNYSLKKEMYMNFDYNKYYTKDALKYIDTENNDYYANIISVGKDEFKRLLKANKIKENNFDFKALLIDNSVSYDQNEQKYINLNLIDLNKTKTITGNISDKSLSLDIVSRIKEKPMGFENTYSNTPTLIVTDEFFDFLVNNYEVHEDTGILYLKCNDPEKMEKQIKEKITSNNVTNYHIYNIENEAKAQRNIIILVSIFLYGFIIVISLIGITNIINTINTNMNLRRRELAMLKSIGMTKKEFSKMIDLESIMYSTKSLIIGIPLGIAGSFLIYKAFASGNDFGYLFPTKAIIISIIVVYLLVSIIMYFALRKTRNENIIETIKDENI